MKIFRLLVSSVCAVPFAATALHAAVTISNAKTKNMSCTGGVCMPTGGNANLNAGDLTSMLASSDVTVKSNATAPDIGILDPLTWASSHRLTLDAYESIHVRATVAVEGTAGVTIITNDGGSGGDYTFSTTTSGAITFWDLNSSLVINGQSYALVSDVKTLASDIAAHPNQNFALSNDYDSSPDGTYGAPPVATTLAGTFEGLGHTISSLTVRTKIGVHIAGLFADIGASGTVRDIRLANASMTARQAAGVGTLAAQNDGSILNCEVSGTVSALESRVGGLAGSSGGKILGSSAAVNVTAGKRSMAGGLVGFLTGGSIESSHASGNVKTDVQSRAGGLVGLVGPGTILNASASGAVVAGSGGGFLQIAGGLVGENQGTIEASFASGIVTGSCCSTTEWTDEPGDAEVGGLVGENYGKIDNVYATGGSSIAPFVLNNGIPSVGGLIGGNGGKVSVSYSTGSVQNEAHVEFSGGLIGHDKSSPIKKSYWDFDTSGITDPSQGAGAPKNDRGITGLTDAQLKSGLPAGFNPSVWGQDPNINNGWPYLLANPPQQ